MLFVEADGTTRAFDTEVTIGRHPASTIVLSDERVSRQHATVRVDGQRWRWDDHSSRGTWHRGTRVRRLVIDGAVTLISGIRTGRR